MSDRSKTSRKALLIAAACLLGAPCAPAVAGDLFISGVAPDRRPEGAPRITTVAHPQAWYVHAVSGIVPPYPRSLFFLDNQGDWYTPFNRPGMPGPYDLRGWYKKS